MSGELAKVFLFLLLRQCLGPVVDPVTPAVKTHVHQSGHVRHLSALLPLLV